MFFLLFTEILDKASCLKKPCLFLAKLTVDENCDRTTNFFNKIEEEKISLYLLNIPLWFYLHSHCGGTSILGRGAELPAAMVVFFLRRLACCLRACLMTFFEWDWEIRKSLMEEDGRVPEASSCLVILHSPSPPDRLSPSPSPLDST